MIICKKKVMLEGNHEAEAFIEMYDKELCIDNGYACASYELTKEEAHLLGDWLLNVFCKDF